ncbi:3-oxo-5-alpha-steroid 4-dehydrogenase [Chitinophaga solisilvae]|uniref:3-oxo-5-alpha-steroid 4-dehydrogenase 1 n=1 Tax=Chitinophaga solisilvae TaxID=1233460 RepID=A0A9Q5D005_9BACT|nr:3-oxo-5-alpha-steroid 4-dehydrogenase [Chitinophaga solisilvae]NSL85614.1 3-oxo-5-alpha-steroid 4-dehydrogenase [Chitinophaga solisilvae]
MNWQFSPAQYYWFIGCWSAIGIGAGIYLLKRAAPYGRYTSENWGPLISNKIGWILMEATVLVSFFAWMPLRSFQWRTPAGLMVVFFLLHYLHRSFVYPFMIRTRGKKMPLVIMLSAVLFNTVNGSLLGIWFARFADYSVEWLTTPAFLAGTLLFFTGMAINLDADYRLIRLRKIHETGYKIPFGGMFRYVSSPNLLGEIIEWGGYALLTWSFPALAFFIWTCANLIPRAIANQQWYQRQFPDFPVQRRALLPFIW